MRSSAFFVVYGRPDSHSHCREFAYLAQALLALATMAAVHNFGRAPTREHGSELPGVALAAKPVDRPSLRLALSQGALAIELYEPFALGPLHVAELVVRLPSVRFPVDLSGGLTRFRHRRGELSKLTFNVDLTHLALWAASRLRGVVDESTPELRIAVMEAGALVSLRWGDVALAFDVVVAPRQRDIWLLPERARGFGLGAPPHQLALRVLSAIGGKWVTLTQGALVITDAVGMLVKHLLPVAGARAPSVAGVHWESLSGDAGWVTLAAAREALPFSPGNRAVRALELCEIVGEADGLAFTGHLDEARHRYLHALERAPRHPEIATRLAWIDALVGDRPEAALSTIVETMPAVDAGVLGGMLLEAVGDVDGAFSAFSRSAHDEPVGVLSALAWRKASQLTQELDLQLEALDQAVAHAPALEVVRWARFETRLRVADLRGAMADAEHLEAATRGAELRYKVWHRVAEACFERGYLAEARKHFERALRYIPDDLAATVGLARSMRAVGETRRALDLLSRASSLAERKGLAAHAVTLELASGLVEIAGDRSAAISRVRSIPTNASEALQARLLEGRWRAELGDVAGASLALSQFRDGVELAIMGGFEKLSNQWAIATAGMLMEAAHIEERERGDVLAAQRLMGLAIRLRPRDSAISMEFRRLADELAKSAAKGIPGQPPDARAAPISVAVEKVEIEPPPSSGLPDSQTSDEPDNELMADRLTDQLRANPSDHNVAMQLAHILARLGRDMDLLALLSARIEEGDERVRQEMMPLRREVMLRLAEQARKEDRPGEAELYEMMLAAEAEQG